MLNCLCILIYCSKYSYSNWSNTISESPAIEPLAIWDSIPIIKMIELFQGLPWPLYGELFA